VSQNLILAAHLPSFENQSSSSPTMAPGLRYTLSSSSLHSCEFFVFGAKIREAFLLGKMAREWRSLVLT
jgi:hypothetical protein